MFKFAKQVFKEFSKDKAGQLSAAFAYVAVFSIGPLLLVVVSIVGLIYGHQAASGQLYDRLVSSFGPDTARTLQNAVAHLSQTGSGISALLFGIFGLLFGAIGLTSQLQNSFDSILGATADPKAGFKFTVYTKLKNLVVIIMASLVALGSIIASAIITGQGKGAGWEILNNVASALIFIWIIYMLYRVMPNVVIPRRLAYRTAIFISILLIIGKFVLGIIIGRNGTASAYGAAASLVVLLLWFYYTAQILMLGAEGIKVYADRHDIDFKTKRFTIRIKRFELHIKDDIPGKVLDSFIRNYQAKKSKD